MTVQPTVHQLPPFPVPASAGRSRVIALRNALATVSPWVGWLIAFFAINAAVSTILLLSRASGTSAALDQLPLDDSWIHLVYIRALVTEGCLCYNTGVWEAGATSWSWILVNSPFYLVGTEIFGIDPVFVIKFVGVLTSAFAALFAFLIVRRITGSRIVGLLAVLLMALEPTFAFSRVSGMEAPIVVATVLGSTLAILHRRYSIAGFALALAFWSRPEAGLFVAAALLAVGFEMVYRNRRTLLLLGRQTLEFIAADNPRPEWVKTVKVLRRATRSWSLLWVMLPAAGAVLIWTGYNTVINGSIYPNTYLVKHDETLPIVPIENISNVFHWGISFWQPWLSGGILPVAVLIYLAGVYLIAKRGRWVYLPLALFPLLIIIGVSRGQSFDETPFMFWTRRYVDPTAPVIVMMLLLGAWALVMPARKYVNANAISLRFRLFVTALTVGGVVALAASAVSGSIDNWMKLEQDYSWNSRNVEETDVAAGLWVRQNVPADASVIVADAGAIRYFGNRFTYDSFGLNSHDLIGRVLGDMFITEKPYAAAVYATAEIENLPVASRHELFTTDFGGVERGSPVAHGPVGVYTFDWAMNDLADASQMHLSELDGQVVDQLNLSDEESELAHNHFISFVSYAPNAVLDLDGVVVEDRGLLHRGQAITERFSVNAVKDSALTLVLRHITDEQESFVQPEVFVNGSPAGRMPIEPATGVAQETAFTVPASMVTSDRLDIEVRWNITTTQFRWWAVAEGS